MPESTIAGFERYIKTELCLSKETVSAYVRDVREFLVFVGEEELTAKLIEFFISHLRQRGLKTTTVRRKYMSVRCLCHHLISTNSLDPKILDVIDSVRTVRRIPDAIESKDVDTLISSLENRIPISRTTNVRRDTAIILTMYHSGLRVSELCGLNIEDVVLSRREIRVSGKGGRDRVVPTTQRCLYSIGEYMNYERRSDTDALFVKADGQRVTRRAVSDMLMSLSRRAGVEHTTSHTLRRSCATSLMNSGVDLELVKMMLGHQHLSTTQTYLAISHDRLSEVHRNCHPFGENRES